MNRIFSRNDAAPEVDPKQDYSWFAAMVESQGERHVIVVLVEQAGHGSTTAAPIARHIIELHHGEITADSDGPGHGASFTVSLRIHDSGHEHHGHAARRRRVHRHARPRQHDRLERHRLVGRVDDDVRRFALPVAGEAQAALYGATASGNPGQFYVLDPADGSVIQNVGPRVRERAAVVATGDAFATDGDRVSIDIVPLEAGCELTLTHEMKPEWAEYAGRTTDGWAGILEGLAAALGEAGEGGGAAG